MYVVFLSSSFSTQSFVLSLYLYLSLPLSFLSDTMSCSRIIYHIVLMKYFAIPLSLSTVSHFVFQTFQTTRLLAVNSRAIRTLSMFTSNTRPIAVRSQKIQLLPQ